jgi:hypothetical protein
MNRQGTAEELRVGRQTIHLTRPQKLLFPDDDIDKRQLAEYYAHIASTMLPYLRDRPVTMERYPDGIQGARLIQKQAARYFHQWIRTASVEKQGGTVRHVICHDAATLSRDPCALALAFSRSGTDDAPLVARAALKGRKLMLRAMVVAVSALGFTVMMAAPAGATAQVKEKTERAAKKTGEVITDSAITTEVKTKLLAAKGVPGSKIEVDTANGTVTLKGAVPTRAARAKAVRITRRSKGVKHVVDQLTIGAS